MSSSKKHQAAGSVTRVSANRIQAVFAIDGYTYSFEATLNPSLPPFTSKSATLGYDSVDDLTGTHTYKGSIGQTNFSLQINNGPITDGDLNFPSLESKNQVDGSGSWVQT